MKYDIFFDNLFFLILCHLIICWLNCFSSLFLHCIIQDCVYKFVITIGAMKNVNPKRITIVRRLLIPFELVKCTMSVMEFWQCSTILTQFWRRCLIFAQIFFLVFKYMWAVRFFKKIIISKI